MAELMMDGCKKQERSGDDTDASARPKGRR